MSRKGIAPTGVRRTTSRTRARRNFLRWQRYADRCYALGAPLRLTGGLARAWTRYHIAERGRAPR